MRALGWKTRARSEGEIGGILFLGCTVDRPFASVIGLSMSISVGTRKMVNYA